MAEQYELLASPDIRRVSLQAVDDTQLEEDIGRSLQSNSTCSLLNDPRKQRLAKRSLKKLKMAAGLCFFFMIGEFVGGYLSNSVAVYSDALHMLSDLTGFLINIFGLRLSLRPPSELWTYGYERVEIVAAILSILLILILTIGLCWEAGNRIVNPPEVDGSIMIVVAMFGITTNIILGCILSQGGHGHSHFGFSSGGECHSNRANASNELAFQELDSSSAPADTHSHHAHQHGDGHSISVQSAYLHALGDLLQNIGVLIAGIMIAVDPKKFKVMDPICTFCFAILVFVITVPLICRAMYVLMETAPKDFNAKEMAAAIAGLDYVQAVRDFHVWNVGYTQTVLTAKLDVLAVENMAEENPSCCHCAVQATVREKVEQLALEKGINHVNLDIVVVSCLESKRRENSCMKMVG